MRKLSPEPYTFDAELSLARMAVGLASRHKDDPACAGLVHQVRRLSDRYQNGGLEDRAAKLDRILAWWDAGCPELTERVVLSEQNEL